MGRQASPRRMKQDVQQIWFATRQQRYFRFNEGLRWAAGSSPRSVNNKCKRLLALAARAVNRPAEGIDGLAQLPCRVLAFRVLVQMHLLDLGGQVVHPTARDVDR